MTTITKGQLLFMLRAQLPLFILNISIQCPAKAVINALFLAQITRLRKLFKRFVFGFRIISRGQTLFAAKQCFLHVAHFFHARCIVNLPLVIHPNITHGVQ